jgi:hypothetical protein
MLFLCGAAVSRQSIWDWANWGLTPVFRSSLPHLGRIVADGLQTKAGVGQWALAELKT